MVSSLMKEVHTDECLFYILCLLTNKVKSEANLILLKIFCYTSAICDVNIFHSPSGVSFGCAKHAVYVVGQ